MPLVESRGGETLSGFPFFCGTFLAKQAFVPAYERNKTMKIGPWNTFSDETCER